MARINVAVNKNPIFTHEGAKASHINPEQQLRRSVMSCMLWEREFYEDGESIADRIKKNIPLVKAETVASIAIEAREKMKLRHVPLLIVREMARLNTHKHLVASTLERIIQRADELSEFVSIYWKEGKQPLSAQVKKGLARAFVKFDEHSLAKYNRDNQVKLRDVIFLCHAKPKDGIKGYTKEARKNGMPRPKDSGSQLYGNLVYCTLAIPETWEVLLSSGADKKETFERLIREKKLGGMAFLRNLRGMKEAGVSEEIIFTGLSEIKTDRILPFRFIAAARYAPQWEGVIEIAMMKCLKGKNTIKGKTTLLIDVSGSMDSAISMKSELLRIDAACGLAILLREVCEDVEIYSFSNQLKQVPARRGFALRDAIVNSQPHQSTYLAEALRIIPHHERLILVTDEQSHDDVPNPKIDKAYMINVAIAKNGVGYGAWMHIDGWSEAVIDYITEIENE